MSAVRLFREEIGLLGRGELVHARKELFKVINGDAFFPLKSWPRDIQLIFWRKPMTDRETFKLVLFLLGNGCAPDLICQWVLTAQFWADSLKSAEKRARQVDFILNNADKKGNAWFYYDIDHQRLLWLNGLAKPETRK